MALESTQLLTEMSTRSISWGKGGRCARLTTLPPSCAVVMKSGNLNFLEPSGPLQACNGTAVPLPFYTTRMPQFKIIKLRTTLLGEGKLLDIFGGVCCILKCVLYGVLLSDG